MLVWAEDRLVYAMGCIITFFMEAGIGCRVMDGFCRCRKTTLGKFGILGRAGGAHPLT